MYVCLLYHTSFMMTTYMQISRVPACPRKLSDRQRETRKVGKEYLVLHTQSCPKAVAPATALSRWTDHRLDAVADLIFCPSIAVRPTLPLSIHLRYSLSGVVRGIIIGSGRLEVDCAASASTPPASSPLPHRHFAFGETGRDDEEEADISIDDASALGRYISRYNTANPP
jgi:hypothetical protein